jgi:hypothetical protein
MSGSGNANILCFREGSKILCFLNNKEIYIPVQYIRKGMLVKTHMDGYKKVEMIGTSKIYNPGHNLNCKNRLYKCTKENYPEIIDEDLIITGCHSILVSELTDVQRETILENFGNIYITGVHYRLMACIDERSQPFLEEGYHNIWHFSLENEEYYDNYGVYANGLLVETTSNRMMKELSGLTLID